MELLNDDYDGDEEDAEFGEEDDFIVDDRLEDARQIIFKHRDPAFWKIDVLMRNKGKGVPGDDDAEKQ